MTYQFHVLPTDETVKEGEEATFLWLQFHTAVGECSHQLEIETDSEHCTAHSGVRGDYILCGEGIVQFIYRGHEGLGHLDLGGVYTTCRACSIRGG